MTTTGGFELHPEAAQDIIAIWEHIARDNPVAATVTAATSTTDGRDSSRPRALLDDVERASHGVSELLDHMCVNHLMWWST